MQERDENALKNGADYRKPVPFGDRKNQLLQKRSGSHSLLVAAFHIVPVDQAAEVFNIVRPEVLVLQIIGVFPNVTDENVDKLMVILT